MLLLHILHLASAGADYIGLVNENVTFIPGDFAQTISVDTLPDISAEGNEVFQAFLSAVTSDVDITSTTSLVTITEDSMWIDMCIHNV